MSSGSSERNQKLKILVLDLDGTVLDKHKEITAENKTSIKKAVEAGIIVVICSGRIHSGAYAYANELGIDGPLISSNGALIRNIKDNRIIYSNHMNIKDAKRVIEICKSMDLYVHAYIDDAMVTEKLKYTSLYYSEKNKIASNNNKIDLRQTNNILDYLDQNIEQHVYKLVIISEHSSELLEFRRQVEKIPGVETVSSSFDNVEVMNKGVNKGKALQILCDFMGIDIKQTIAIGDNENDIELIKAAGIGVAMGNAEAEVKAAAQYITDTNQNSGVAKAIEKYFGIKV